MACCPQPSPGGGGDGGRKLGHGVAPPAILPWLERGEEGTLPAAGRAGQELSK